MYHHIEKDHSNNIIAIKNVEYISNSNILKITRTKKIVL